MAQNDPYNINYPSTQRAPILISVPHCGLEFPEDVTGSLRKELVEFPDDTDWFVDRLYDFAGEMGITVISAVYNRWVIDLNRDPEDKPLYSDGRMITGLLPKTSFTGERLYQLAEPDRTETERRIEKYYNPYHQKLASLLGELQAIFGTVLLWEAHSIREFMPTINQQFFPNLILGDADGTSASPDLSSVAFENLKQSPYKIAYNNPFKGGHITRKFGDPKNGIHALQLEMTKVTYMDEAEIHYDIEKSEKVREVLRSTFEALIYELLR